MEQTKTYGISGFSLKVIALVTMLIDHAAVGILTRLYLQTDLFSTNRVQWYIFYRFLRGVGRMAFPIYCFLLVEGFRYTRNRWKYAARLAVFAFLSELPFDAALRNSWWDTNYSNVFFTLLIGLLTLMALEWVEERFPTDGTDVMLQLFWRLLILVVMCILAEYGLHTDYGMSGVLTIVIMYQFRENRILAFVLAVVLLALGTSTLEFAALLMVIPLYYYNGSRGPAMNKYIFYAFYPGHLALIAVIDYFLGLGI